MPACAGFPLPHFKWPRITSRAPSRRRHSCATYLSLSLSSSNPLPFGLARSFALSLFSSCSAVCLEVSEDHRDCRERRGVCAQTCLGVGVGVSTVCAREFQCACEP